MNSWYKISLPTAIAVAAVAAVLLWLNLRHYHTDNSWEIESKNQASFHYSFSANSSYHCGWPFIAYTHNPTLDVKLQDRHFLGALTGGESESEWRPGWAFLDAFIVILILILTAMACEHVLLMLKWKK